MSSTTTELLVARSDLRETRLRQREDSALADGQVRVRIDHFALTSNNITYAAMGDAMHYWEFYPTGEEGWGIVPVWGFGDVVQSLHPGVAVGERLYGFFPMASAAVLTPERLSPEGFREGALHRKELPAVYNQFFRSGADPLYRADNEALQALLRPLFITSWLIDDFLADNDFFDARDAKGRAVAILSSASSKTAYGTAWALAQRGDVEVIGLTSAPNVAFCESLGCYHRVVRYDELDRIAEDTPCVYVDFAGNGPLRQAIHSRFTQLRYSCSIGASHVDQLAAPGSAKNLPGPRATLFFAPEQIRKRTKEWGADEFSRRMTQAWQGFIAKVGNAEAPWLRVSRHQGPPAVAQAWAEVLAGRTDPRTGHILSLR